MKTKPLTPELTEELAQALEREFALDENRARRVREFYLPIFAWLSKLIGESDGAFFLGINAPQGAGKSTLARVLVDLAKRTGLNAINVSIDDFYLTRSEQIQLAAAHPENLFLQQRGYPGTHDVELGARVLDALAKLKSGQWTRIPCYEKSLHQGKGDRLPEDRWRRVQGPLDLVILEGWMLGFEPVADADLSDRRLVAVNEALSAYSRWTDRFDARVVLAPENPLWVLDWRVEAEERMKAEGKPGMSQEEIRRYIELFLPAYSTYASGLFARAMDATDLRLMIGRNRLPSVAVDRN